MSRQHTRATVGHVEVHVIVTAPDAAPIADVEEAVKAAARNAIGEARVQAVTRRAVRPPTTAL